MSRTPFLDGALRVIYLDGPLPATCPECAFDWTPGASSADASIATISASTDEMLAQLTTMPGSMLVGWDPDVLADARSYTKLPTPAANGEPVTSPTHCSGSHTSSNTTHSTCAAASVT